MSAKKAMPEHLKRKLIADGVMTERGLTMTPKARQCRRCRAWCWAGLPDIGPAAGVWVSFAPTTVFGELLALSVGMATYEYSTALLRRRSLPLIQEISADKTWVHVHHTCNGPPLPIHPKWKQEPPGEKTFSEIPPF